MLVVGSGLFLPVVVAVSFGVVHWLLGGRYGSSSRRCVSDASSYALVLSAFVADVAALVLVVVGEREAGAVVLVDVMAMLVVVLLLTTVTVGARRRVLVALVNGPQVGHHLPGSRSSRRVLLTRMEVEGLVSRSTVGSVFGSGPVEVYAITPAGVDMLSRTRGPRGIGSC